MADRVFSYVFRGDFGNLKAGLTAAQKNVSDLSGKMTALDKDGAKMRAGLSQVGDTAGKVGLAAAAGLGAVVLTAANFDKAMSAVSAVTGETAENMDKLREAAIKAGADTAFSRGEPDPINATRAPWRAAQAAAASPACSLPITTRSNGRRGFAVLAAMINQRSASPCSFETPADDTTILS